LIEVFTPNCILQWNLQSFRTKFQDLKLLLKQHIPACICLQETLLTDRTSHPPSGYKLVQSVPIRQDGHERGAAVLVHNRVSYEPVQLNTTLQAAAVRVHLSRKYTVCSLYLPHIPVSLREIEDLVRQLPTPFLLLGDMNAKSTMWGGETTDQRGHIFEQLLLNHSLCILNDLTPTHYHVQTNSSSIIDLSIVSADCAQDFTYSVLSSLNGSDHYPIKLSIVNPETLYDSIDRFNFDKADWKKFSELTKVDNFTANSQTIDEQVTAITDIIIAAAQEAIPIKGKPIGRTPVPWFNEDCRSARLARTRAERAVKRNPSQVNIIAYNRAKAVCRLTFKQAQKQSWQKYVSSINSRTPPSKIWKRVAKISGKFKQSPTPVLHTPAGDIRDHKEVADIMAHHFSSVSGVQNYSRQFLTYKTQIEEERLNLRSNENLAYNNALTHKELISCLSLTVDSSPGLDMITYSMIKHVHPSMLNLILELFNRIYLEHQFPHSWRTSIVIPILKPGKNSHQPSSYRPISLTSCLCKLLEKMVNLRLMFVLERDKILPPNQSGFRKNRCTMDNLIQLETDISNAIEQKLHSIAVFFDIKKAYDTAWRYGVVKALHTCGLRGSLIHFVWNFLKQRSIVVRIGSVVSRVEEVSEGIPQGSVLSCTCFIVAMNEVSRNLPAYVKSNVYVDDFMIYSSGPLPHVVERRLQVALNHLKTWSNHSGLTFSTEKTVCMHLCRRRGCNKIVNSLSINGTIINCVDSYKYLGMHIDNGFTWKCHITHLRTACAKLLDLLKHISHKHWGADRIALLRLYVMLVKPKLDYGSEIYSSAAPSTLDRLTPIHNAAIRIATGAFRSSPLISLYAESGIKPIDTYRNIKSLNTAARIYANPLHPLHEQLAAVTDEEVPTGSKCFISRCADLCRRFDINFEYIISERPAIQPLWMTSELSSCKELLNIGKNAVTPNILKHIFEAHYIQHSGDICVFTDGSKSPDGTSFAFIYDQYTYTRKVQAEASIFTAELMAILKALRHVSDHSDSRPITVFTDSRAAIMAINKYPQRCSLAQHVQEFIVSLRRRVTLCWVPSHVGVAQNEAVDSLARTASTNQVLRECAIPRSDYKAKIRRVVNEKWHNDWQAVRENKFRAISHDTKPLPNSSSIHRSWEIVLCRLRIGHTTLTHGYLMEGSQRPYCQDCLVPLTVIHFVTECPTYREERMRYFGRGPYDIGNMLTGINSLYDGPMYRFLICTRMFNKI